MIRIFLLLKRFINKVRNLFCHRKAIFQLEKAKALLGNEIRFNGTTIFHLKGKISIGDRFVCNSTNSFCINEGHSMIVVKDNAELTIGYCSGISNTILHCHNRISIGDHVNIGAGTIIFDTNFHSTDWRKRENRIGKLTDIKTAPIYIEDYVFIGANCIISKGVTIGEKSIIAAGSVVTRDIPSCEIWGGNPAKFIKKID